MKLRTWLLLLPGLAAAAQGAPDERDALARRLGASLETLEALRADRARALEAAEADRRGGEQTIRALEAELERVRRELAQAGARRAEVARAEEGAGALAEALEALLAAGADAAREALAAWRPGIAQGIGWRRDERLAAADALLAALAPGAHERGAAVAGALGFLVDELGLAATVELAAEPVLLEDGRVRTPAFVARLGLVLEAFRSEDGARVGLRRGAAWTTELGARARGVAALVEALRGQRAPGVVVLGIPAAER